MNLISNISKFLHDNVRPNSPRIIKNFKSKDNLNISKDFSVILSGYKYSNAHNKSNINIKPQCNDVKYVKRIFSKKYQNGKQTDKFLNKQIDRKANGSPDNSLLKCSSTKKLERQFIKKLDKSNSFILPMKTKIDNKFHLNGNYSKYIDISKLNKNCLIMNNSNSLIENSFENLKNNPLNVDLFTFNSHKIKNEKDVNKFKREKLNEDFIKLYRSSEFIHKRNKIIDDNCLFYLSFSKNHNLTYSNAEMKKLLSSSFNELLRNRNKSDNKKGLKRENVITKTYADTNIPINIPNKNIDVDTVEDLHYLNVRFYQKNKDKGEDMKNKKNSFNSALLQDELDIND